MFAPAPHGPEPELLRPFEDFAACRDQFARQSSNRADVVQQIAPWVRLFGESPFRQD